MVTLRLTVVLASLVVATSLVAQTPARRLVLADYLEWEDVADPQLSPHGGHVVYLRTPISQTREYYQALKYRKAPTAMVRFNAEYHGTSSKPSNFMRTQLYLPS